MYNYPNIPYKVPDWIVYTIILVLENKNRMNTLSILGKYLDQPRLVGKFSNAVPALLIGGAAAYTTYQVNKAPKEQKRKTFIKNAAVLTGTTLSALVATRGLGHLEIGKNVIVKGFEGLSERINLKEVKETQTELVNNFLKENKVSEKTAELLNKAKTSVLKFSEIKKVFSDLGKNEKEKEFLDELIPNPENIDSKEIFGEIKRLSLFGLIPVLGGIAGGIVGDKLTEKNWKDRIPNKVKEGSYQYLANIFLCNVGAGAALAVMEKAKVTSKSTRAFGMIGGILLTGVVAGSAMANAIGKAIIDPIFGHKHNLNREKLYSERTPEALDIGLHVDDVATVAVMSGLKWIEPALPILYSISGYRAGIGYRNNGEEPH